MVARSRAWRAWHGAPHGGTNPPGAHHRSFSVFLTIIDLELTSSIALDFGFEVRLIMLGYSIVRTTLDDLMAAVFTLPEVTDPELIRLPNVRHSITSVVLRIETTSIPGHPLKEHEAILLWEEEALTLYADWSNWKRAH